MGLLILFSAFTGSRLVTLLADNNSSCRDSEENSTNNLSGSTLVYNSDGDTLIDNKPDLKTRIIKSGTICYGDIDLFLLRNSDNPERDILMAEVNFRNLKNRSEGADG
jgi:hypothetical protein